jgi:hypothetical protein
MSKTKDGGPAFPQLQENRVIHVSASGMSLRDAAALAALQGMLAYGVGFRPAETPDLHWHNVVAREAWAVADAFIAARETKEGEG